MLYKNYNLKKPAEIPTKKLKGRFYTPKFIVECILDLSNYYGSSILKKHIIDNSCGDGAFLVTIVDRYCNEFLKSNNDLTILAKELSTFIHGIEIDINECNKCIENLNKTTKSYGVNNVYWDIVCGDALSISKYDSNMDFVIGNPPYVRVHNLGDSFENIKNFSFSKNGMADLYLVFYEIGLKMLNSNGVLGYITPNSYFNSLAGRYMRSYFITNNLIDKIVDLKHYQIFSSTTYTTITILKNNRNKSTTDYYNFENIHNLPKYIDTLNVKDFYICDNFYFAEKKDLTKLKDILSFDNKSDHFIVKNGFATLLDKFFIGNFNFDDYTIPIIKASTGKTYKCIFPYSEGKLVPYNELTANPNLKDYFETYRNILSKRSLDKNGSWYGFGRTQGINDISKHKYSVNTIIKSPADLKLTECEKGVGVYSGLYIITEVKSTILRDILYNKNFITYVSMLGKYKNNNYYTFSSKDLKKYLEYEFSQRSEFTNE